MFWFVLAAIASGDCQHGTAHPLLPCHQGKGCAGRDRLSAAPVFRSGGQFQEWLID
jgi:hypothetical protein